MKKEKPRAKHAQLSEKTFRQEPLDSQIQQASRPVVVVARGMYEGLYGLGDVTPPLAFSPPSFSFRFLEILQALFSCSLSLLSN